MEKIKKEITPILTALMFFAVVYRGPSLPGEIRGWFEVYFEIALTMGLAAVIWHFNKWIAAFLVMVEFFVFFPFYGSMSYMAGRSVFNGCLWYLFIVLFFDVQSLNALYRIMRIFVYFHVPIAILQRFGVAGVLSVPLPTGLMANPLELSALIVFCFPAFLVLKGKSLFLIIIPVIGIIVAKQFLGIVALGVGMVFYFAIVRKSYCWPAAAFLVVLIIWNWLVDAPGIGLRKQAWEKIFWAWLQHPFLGAGIGHFKAVFNKTMGIEGKRWMTAHNEFLQMLFELGIGFAVILTGYVFDLYKKYTREIVIPLTAIVMIAVTSMASFPFHIAPTAIIAITWMAIFEVHTCVNS